MKKTRKIFLTVFGRGVITALFIGLMSFKSPSSSKANVDNIKFGIASYTFKNFTLDETLEMTKRLGISRISLKAMHLPLDASDELITSTLEKCEAAGIHLYGGGVIKMKTKDDVDNAFEYARKAKMEMIIGVPWPNILPYVEKKVKETGIKVAIHIHGPEDKRYPSAEVAYNYVKDMDPGMGICLDIGHTARLNRNPSKDLVKYFDRIFDIHIKDETSTTADGETCEIGRGVIDINTFLKTVIKKKYSGTLSFEFEKDPSDPLPGLAESVGYVKGIMSTIK